MKVEQRIGRIDRIRQEREVHVFNMALEGYYRKGMSLTNCSAKSICSTNLSAAFVISSLSDGTVWPDFEREVFENYAMPTRRWVPENNSQRDGC